MIKAQKKDPNMAKIIKVINDLNPDEALFWEIESNASITLQEGKPFSIP